MQLYGPFSKLLLQLQEACAAAEVRRAELEGQATALESRAADLEQSCQAVVLQQQQIDEQKCQVQQTIGELQAQLKQLVQEQQQVTKTSSAASWAVVLPCCSAALTCDCPASLLSCIIMRLLNHSAKSYLQEHSTARHDTARHNCVDA